MFYASTASSLSSSVDGVKDKGYAGLHPAATAFFWSWGVWNLYYYPHLDQWWSFTGGVSLVIANTTWVAMMLKFGRKA